MILLILIKKEQNRQWLEHGGNFGTPVFPNIKNSNGNGNGEGKGQRNTNTKPTMVKT